jgi:hypothetical protein
MLLKSPRAPSFTVREPEEVGKNDWNVGVTARLKSFRLEKLPVMIPAGVAKVVPLTRVTQFGGLLVLGPQPEAKPMDIPPVLPTTW